MRLNLFIAHSDKRRLLMRTLNGLGPTWVSSPVRRIVQGLCLAVFAALFLYVSWPYGSRQYSEILTAREWINAEVFLTLDPLVSLSTAIAARMWVWSLVVAAAAIGVCMVIPRGFCGYICPMGTFLDIFDWTIGRRVPLFRAKDKRWWVNLRYFVLVLVLVSAAFGILLSGFVAAIAVWTRAMLMILAPLQMGLLKGWYLVPPMNLGHWISLLLFGGIVGMSLLERRFWCKYLCPSGAIFSLTALLSLTRRKVSTDCIGCGQCEKVCDFAAIREDFSTHHSRCTFCQSCGGVCPAGAIQFTDRWNSKNRKPFAVDTAATCSRRSLLTGLGTAAAAGMALAVTIRRAAAGEPPVRAPGSVPEEAFLQLCVRCEQCIKVCPNNVLQPNGLENGLESLWTPRVVADWSGCEPSCNNCGQVCPTGAIRALSLVEKRAARIALAVVDKQTCLPYARRKECRYCVDECNAAGYEAIEFIRVGGKVDDIGRPVEGSGMLAPVVLKDKCVGCGLCQMRCRAMNVKNEHLLNSSAIVIRAGADREDRLFSGSYVELQRRRQGLQTERSDATNDEYLPDFLR